MGRQKMREDKQFVQVTQQVKNSTWPFINQDGDGSPGLSLNKKEFKKKRAWFSQCHKRRSFLGGHSQRMALFWTPKSKTANYQVNYLLLEWNDEEEEEEKEEPPWLLTLIEHLPGAKPILDTAHTLIFLTMLVPLPFYRWGSRGTGSLSNTQYIMKLDLNPREFSTGVHGLNHSTVLPLDKIASPSTKYIVKIKVKQCREKKSKKMY